jgi:hypothetical protein
MAKAYALDCTATGTGNIFKLLYFKDLKGEKPVTSKAMKEKYLRFLGLLQLGFC